MSAMPACEKCGVTLRFETDWLGRAYYDHPGRCVIRPVYHIRECTICHNEVVFEQQPSYRQKLFACSPQCERQLELRRKLAIAASDERRRARKHGVAA